MNLAPFLRFSSSLALLAVVATTPSRAAPPALGGSPRVAPEVRSALHAEGFVLVHFDFHLGPALDVKRASRADRLRAIAETTRGFEAMLQGTGAEVVRRFGLVPALTLWVDAPALEILEADPRVIGIDLEARGRLFMDQAGPLVTIDDVHLEGYEGAGVTVAVIDSGIDTNHTDLSSDIADEQCYCAGSCCPNGQTSQSGAGAAEDANGHGTHVSGIITSDGATAPLGFAPDASVVAIRISGATGSMSMSDVIAALDWIALNQPGVSVVNLSLGTLTQYSGSCDTATSWLRSMSTSVSNLTTTDVAVFAASGNDAVTTGLPAPACLADVIAVGSVYDDNLGSVTFSACSDASSAADQITCYSNDDTTLDLLAPGSAITSTRMNGGQVTFHGTSMASPAAAACAALLYEANPSLTFAELETAIESSNTTISDARTNRSYPRLDCAEALAVAAPDTDGDGIRDPSDNCPSIANANQADRDADGVGDVCDACPDDPDNDADADGVCGDVDNCPADANAGQEDGDADELGDVCDACPLDPDNDADADGVCGDVDNCPTDANAGQEDGDADSTGDVCDACPLDPDDDADADGVCGDVDNCPADANAGQEDADADAAGDVCDACPLDPDDDADVDGVCGDVDNCPAAANADQADTDADATGDACDVCPLDPDDDIDADGVCGDVDNCPAIANADQANEDGDATGDVCDACPLDADDDADDDGLCGDVDNCPAVANAGQENGDEDAAGDVCDACPLEPYDDADGDGACGDVDNCPAITNPRQDDVDGDGQGDACDVCPDDVENDADGDGVCESSDLCPAVADPGQLDADLDGVGDACDACPNDPDDDADGDGLCADVDNCPVVANATQADEDGDGVGDACAPEGCRCVTGSPSSTRNAGSLALVAGLGVLVSLRRQGARSRARRK